jgi:hypothetical protein
MIPKSPFVSVEAEHSCMAWQGGWSSLQDPEPSLQPPKSGLHTAIISTSSQTLYQRFSRHKRQRLPFPCHVNQLYPHLSITTRTIIINTSWRSRNLSELSTGQLGACFAPKQLFETKKSREKRALQPNLAPGFHFHQRPVDTVDI